MLVFPIGEKFVGELEERCLEIARYANQDLEAVERWNLRTLFRRYAALARIVERETNTKD